MEVTQRAVLPAEEESQRETASDTLRVGGVLGFVVDTARDSSSEGKHRSELDSGVFSNTEKPFSVNNEYRRRAYPTAGRSEKNQKSIA